MNKQAKNGKRGIEWTEWDAGWLSALIDGEGCILLLKEKRPNFTAGCTYKPRISISNKSFALISRAQELLGGCVVARKKNLLYELDISSAQAYPTLKKFKLTIKHRQSALLIEAIEILRIRTGRGIGPRKEEHILRLEEIYKSIRALNRQENPDE